MTKREIKALFPWWQKSTAATDAEADRGASPVVLVTSGSAEPPKPEQSGETALSAIASKVAAGQERLAMELCASGKNRAEIFEALYDDLKTRKAEAEAKKPEVSAQDVAAEVLKELRAGTPAMPSTNEGAEPNVYEQYKAIEDPVARQAYLSSHKEEIDRIQQSQSTKEGK